MWFEFSPDLTSLQYSRDRCAIDHCSVDGGLFAGRLIDVISGQSVVVAGTVSDIDLMRPPGFVVSDVALVPGSGETTADQQGAVRATRCTDRSGCAVLGRPIVAGVQWTVNA